jgi:hypothetical protein
MEECSNLNHYFDKIYCFCKPSNYSNWNVYKNIYLFIENYFNFYYDYIDSIFYKIRKVEFIDINKFEMETLL